MAVSLTSYKTPGVYVQEISKFPPSIAQVETAIPAFFGNTLKAKKGSEDLTGIPTRITSMLEYEELFGTTKPETLEINIDYNTAKQRFEIDVNAVYANDNEKFMMYYALQSFYANGGGPCFIVSTGPQDGGTIDATVLGNSIVALETEDQPSLLVFPDAVQGLSPTDYNTLMQTALKHCADPKQNNRFVIMDVKQNDDKSPIEDADTFRALSGTIEELKYGATYYPFLNSTIVYNYTNDAVTIKDVKSDGEDLAVLKTALEGELATASDEEKPAIQAQIDAITEMEKLKDQNMNDVCEGSNALYNEIIRAIREKGRVVLPPSSTMAGIYAQTDNSRGVWKAPANIPLNAVIGPSKKISDNDNDYLNVDTTAGKSINAIRAFTGRGNLVWGGRTLAGNDNEWRYVSVRRFFNMVEESTKRALRRYVFEPNNRNTWVKVKAMIENFLNAQWKAGALLGAKPEDAYIVSVGMPDTFSEAEMFEGFMVVEISMAVVRPAEFIVLKFMHKFQDEKG